MCTPIAEYTIVGQDVWEDIEELGTVPDKHAFSIQANPSNSDTVYVGVVIDSTEYPIRYLAPGGSFDFNKDIFGSYPCFKGLAMVVKGTIGDKILGFIAR